MWMSCTPLAGVKPNTVVGDAGLGAEALAEGVDRRRRIGHGTPQPAVQQVGEVVVRADERRRQQAHPGAVEEVAADVVEVLAVGARLERVPAGAERLELPPSAGAGSPPRRGTAARRCLLGLDVHRDAPVLAGVVDEMHLVVREVRAVLPRRADRAGRECAVAVEGHARMVTTARRACHPQLARLEDGGHPSSPPGADRREAALTSLTLLTSKGRVTCIARVSPNCAARSTTATTASSRHGTSGPATPSCSACPADRRRAITHTPIRSASRSSCSRTATGRRSTTPAIPTAAYGSTPTERFDFVARRPITAGEEITFDYAMRNYVIEHFPPACLCGTELCQWCRDRLAPTPRRAQGGLRRPRRSLPARARRGARRGRLG